MPQHYALDSVHLAAHKGDTDPSADPDNHVRPGVFWVDTLNGAPFTLRMRNDADDGWDEVGSVTGGAASNLVDEALTATASASSTGSGNGAGGVALAAACVNDGNQSSAWGPTQGVNPEASWVKLDLGSAKTIVGFRAIQDVYGQFRAMIRWKVQSSPDNAAWTDQFVIDAQEDTGEIIFPSPVSARYWRLLAVSHWYDFDDADALWEVYRFSVFSGEPGPRDSYVSVSVPSATCVYDASFEDEKAIYAFDQNWLLRWAIPFDNSEEELDQWVSVDLGEAHAISYFDGLFNCLAGTLELTVQSSTDNAIWDDQHVFTVELIHPEAHVFDPPITARYWRILCTASTANGFGAARVNFWTGDPAPETTLIYGHVIVDEAGDPVPQRGNLQFVGDGVAVTDDEESDTTIVTIPGGGGGGDPQVVTLSVVLDGGGVEIADGVKADLVVDFACTILGVTLLADQAGSLVVDLWKDSYANYPPVVGDSICAAAKPTISAATKAQDTTLTGWTTSVAAGDIVRVNVDSCTTIQRCTVALKLERAA